MNEMTRRRVRGLISIPNDAIVNGLGGTTNDFVDGWVDEHAHG